MTLAAALGGAQASLLVLAGQSNATGYGGLAQITLPAPVGGVASVSGARHWSHGNKGTDNQWIPLSTSWSAGSNIPFGGSSETYGVEMALGALLAPLHRNLHILRVSYDGSEIARWDGGDIWGIFPGVATTALAAMAQRRYRTLGVVWLQGETDAQTQAAADAYQTRLTSLIARFRGLSTLPDDCRFVLSRLSNNQTWAAGTYRGTVQTAQDAVAAGGTNVVSVNTNTVTLSGDNLHFAGGATSLDRLGRLLANGVDSRVSLT